jgi:hypothetical protein
VKDAQVDLWSRSFLELLKIFSAIISTTLDRLRALSDNWHERDTCPVLDPISNTEQKTGLVTENACDLYAMAVDAIVAQPKNKFKQHLSQNNSPGRQEPGGINRLPL